MKAIRVLTTALLLVVPCHLGAELDPAEAKQVKRYTKTLEKSRKVDERRRAALDLGRIKEVEVVAPLIGALADPDPSVRRQAADSLWRVSEVAAPAEAALRKALEDTSLGVRVRAAAALEDLGVPESELVAARETGLEAERLRDRILAARDLVGFVPGDRLAAPIAEVAAAEADTRDYDLGDKYLDPVKVLERLVAKGDTACVAPLLAEVKAGNPGRRFLLKGLAEVDPKPDEWVDVLIEQLASPREQDREVALALLYDLTTEDAGVNEWIAPVTAVLDDPRVRDRAITALRKAGGFAAPAAPRLAEVVATDEDGDMRARAAGALEEIGNRDQAFASDVLREVAVVSLPALTKAAVEDPDEDVRGAALGTLDHLRVSADEVLPTFLAAAKSDSHDHNRFKALQYIRDLGTDATSAIPDLEAIIAEDQANRGMAEQALNFVKTRPPDFKLESTTTAAAGGSNQALGALRSAGVDFTQHEYYLALDRAQVDTVRLFLDAGMSPDDIVEFGSRPLHALVFGPPGCVMGVRPTPDATKVIVRMLLERGADVNGEDENGNTVLKLAVMACDAEVIQILLDGGADMYATDMHGMTPFEGILWSGTDAADPLLAAGYRLPADKAASYKEAYKDNPKALELIKRASAD